MAPGPFATVTAVAVLCLAPWPADARSLRIATDQEPAGSPSPAAAVETSPAGAPAVQVAASPAPPPPDVEPVEAPPPPPCPNMPPPALPVTELEKRIKAFGDKANEEAGAHVKGVAEAATAEAIAKLQSVADEQNPLKNPMDPAEFEKMAQGPLHKLREELRGNYEEMHKKAEEEAAEVLEKVKKSIHNATRTTVEATIAQYEEKNEELIKNSADHAKQDSNHSLKLSNTAMEAVQTTMDAIAKLQKASDSLPQGEIKNATTNGKRAQETSAAFTKQALGVKQVIESYMVLNYQSHTKVVDADGDQGIAFHIAHDAESQASTNSADIKVLQASVKEANEEAVQAMERAGKLGDTLVSL